MKYRSIKDYLDELIDSVQDFDYHFGCSDGQIHPDKMKRFKKAKSDLRKHIIELRKNQK